MEQQLDSLVSGYEQGAISRRQLLAALTAMTLTPVVSQSAGFVARFLNHVSLDECGVGEAAEELRRMDIPPYVREDKPDVYFQDPDGITVQLENKNYRG